MAKLIQLRDRMLRDYSHRLDAFRCAAAARFDANFRLTASEVSLFVLGFESPAACSQV